MFQWTSTLDVVIGTAFEPVTPFDGAVKNVRWKIYSKESEKKTEIYKKMSRKTSIFIPCDFFNFLNKSFFFSDELKNVSYCFIFTALIHTCRQSLYLSGLITPLWRTYVVGSLNAKLIVSVRFQIVSRVRRNSRLHSLGNNLEWSGILRLLHCIISIRAKRD